MQRNEAVAEPFRSIVNDASKDVPEQGCGRCGDTEAQLVEVTWRDGFGREITSHLCVECLR